MLGNEECPHLFPAHAAGEHDAHGLLDGEIRLDHATARQVNRVAADLVAHGQIDGDEILAAAYPERIGMFLQALVSFTLLRREFRRKLTNLAPLPQPA